MRRSGTLEFEKIMDFGLWRCRYYDLGADTLAYTLAFGTTKLDVMRGLFDQIASSFEFRLDPWMDPA